MREQEDDDPEHAVSVAGGSEKVDYRRLYQLRQNP